MNIEQRKAMEDARHELTTLHGLYAYDNPRPDLVSEDAWRIDTRLMVERLDTALASPTPAPLAQRIETAYDRAVETRIETQAHLRAIAAHEETAKMDNLAEWTGAKNNDIRRSIVLRELTEVDDYHAARRAYQDCRDSFRVTLLEVERLKLLVAAAGVESRA